MKDIDENEVKWSNQYDPPIISISTGRARQWAYSPSFSDCGNQLLAQTNIAMQGSRRGDYTAANLNSGRQQRGAETWHHVHDYNNGTCTMQLVPAALHGPTRPHAGSVKQWRDAHGGAAYNVVLDSDSYLDIPMTLDLQTDEYREEYVNCLKTNKDILENLEKETGFTLSDDVKTFYVSLSNLEHIRYVMKTHFLISDIRIDYIYPPDSSADGIFTILKESKSFKIFPTYADNGNIPIAQTGGGDIFYVDSDGWLYFDDHEDGTQTDLKIKLLDLLP